jgi:hypothetical protein
MTAISTLFSAAGMRRFFGQDTALLERRVQELPMLDVPVLVERRAANVPVAFDRRGPRCKACDFGTMRPFEAGKPGELRCSSPNCGHVQAAA